MAQPVLLYDGDCGFCTSAVHALRRRLHLGATASPWQSADLETVALTPEDASRAVWFVDGERRCSGAQAVAAWLGTGARPLRWVGAVMGAPGARVLAQAVYRVVARNRERIPGPWDRTCAPGAR
jgi:predicted DCC family thiol-disulfide oxidoreductase YuxK